MSDKLLVADDEPDVASLAKMILEKRGYQVLVAPDGEEALRKAEAEMPDLILLDVVMPGKSGLEVCKLLKAQPRTKHIPVVMFTALGREVDRKMAVETGCDGYFMKPFTHEALLAEVKGHLKKARASKFSKQLGLEHGALNGKKILLEFDPSTPYERLVRDFALDRASNGEKVIVLTKRGSAVWQALEGDGDVELLSLAPDTMVSGILEKYPEGSLILVYDSLTDLVLSTDSQTAYKLAQNALGLLSEPRITALFLLNPSAHEQKDVSSMRGLFNSQLVYGKHGITTARLA